MIKLIASDMDGTLLDEKSQLLPETFQLIERLREHGIRFVAASGRRLDTLQEYFKPVEGKVDFVASNGAQVVMDGLLIDNEIFSRTALHRLKEVVDLFDNLHLAVFDRKTSYLLEDRSLYTPEFDKDMPEPVVEGIPGAEVNIIKASVNCKGPIMDMAYVLTREMGDDFVFAPSGTQWIDVMQRGVNKATGIEQILSLQEIDYSEVMAFGDSMNDYELLRRVGLGCAMENGRPALKSIATRVIGTNAEHAVQKELKALLDTLEGQTAALKRADLKAAGSRA